MIDSLVIRIRTFCFAMIFVIVSCGTNGTGNYILKYSGRNLQCNILQEVHLRGVANKAAFFVSVKGINHNSGRICFSKQRMDLNNLMDIQLTTAKIDKKSCIEIPIGKVNLKKRIFIGQWYGSYTMMVTDFQTFSRKTELRINIGK